MRDRAELRRQELGAEALGATRQLCDVVVLGALWSPRQVFADAQAVASAFVHRDRDPLALQRREVLRLHDDPLGGRDGRLDTGDVGGARGLGPGERLQVREVLLPGREVLSGGDGLELGPRRVVSQAYPSTLPRREQANIDGKGGAQHISGIAPLR